MNSLALEILFFSLSFIGVLSSILGIPGNFVAVIVALIATISGDGVAFTWLWFILFLVISASGEVVDQITGVLGAKRFGATRTGMIGALVGGFVGGLLGTAVLPLVGSLIGVFLGCFLLTFLFEYIFSRRSAQESQRAGVGAVLGKAAALSYKIMIGFVLLILMAWRFWFI